MFNKDLNIEGYIESSPNSNTIQWSDLPDSIQLKLKTFPKDIKRLGEFTSIRRLKQSQVHDDITPLITNIRGISGHKQFSIRFPVHLNNIHYVRLYSLMVSEGYYKSEFAVNVPELFFHEMFKSSIKGIISEDTSKLITEDYNKGFLRSRAPAILRYIIPVPRYIPRLILENKDFSREYLRIAFEAEGSPIFDKQRHKRYIKLSRYNNISEYISNENLPITKRIYLSEIKTKYPVLFNKIKNYPPNVLLGEQILLKRHFDIDSQLRLEAIRKNSTGFRAGKISARWVLFIYANNIDKFIKDIGFISERKNELLEEMKEIRGNNPQYYTLDVINRISDKKRCFYRRDFIKEMKRIGYKSPSCNLLRYEDKNLIRKIKRGYYQVKLF